MHALGVDIESQTGLAVAAGQDRAQKGVLDPHDRGVGQVCHLFAARGGG